MRPHLLLAAIALLAAPRPAGAVPAIPAGRAVILPPEGPALRESATVRFTPVEGAQPTLAVAIDVAYPPGTRLPDQDVLHVGREEPSAISAEDEDGRPLPARSSGDHAIIVRLDRPGGREPSARHVRVRFQQPAPAVRRHGWRTATTQVDLTSYGFQVERDVTTVVALPGQAFLVGFTCARRGEETECTRVTPRRMEPFALVLRARPDVLGTALLVLTSLAAVYGFARLTWKRAQALVEAALAVPVPEAERPGGAYRAAPAQAVGLTAGDAGAGLRRLRRQATVIALAAVASTAAVAYFAAGRSPWPMPSVTAAWVALVGFAAALAVERG